jgi:hypothetical protein
MQTPEYLNAYLNGMQFVLLAIEGRIDEFDDEERETLRAFLDEYHEIAMRMRERSRLGVSP